VATCPAISLAIGINEAIMVYGINTFQEEPALCVATVRIAKNRSSEIIRQGRDVSE
jgi:hypothetical protein